MTKDNDNNFEDEEFELGDDIDDPWDYESVDEIDTEDNITDEKNSKTAKNAAKNSARSKNIIKPLVITIVLGGGAYLFLPLIFPSDTQNQIPIIKLEETQDIYTDELEPNEITDVGNADNNADNNIVIDETTPVHTNPLETDASTLEIKEDIYNTVLMPLPENIEEYAPPLAELTNIFEEDDKIQDLIQLKDTKQDLLSEDDLLPKTEATFEASPKEDTVSDKEDVKDIFNLDMENIKEGLPAETLDMNEEVLVNNDSDNIVKETEIETKVEKEVSIEPKSKLDLEIEVETNTKSEAMSESEDKSEPKAEKINKSEKLDDVPSTVKKIKPKPKKNNVIANKKPVWVIRAAGSGSAIIYDKTSREMKSIEINDIVRGLGRIKSIKLIDGVWVIKGTSGKIEQ